MPNITLTALPNLFSAATSPATMPTGLTGDAALGSFLVLAAVAGHRELRGDAAKRGAVERIGGASLNHQRARGD